MSFNAGAYNTTTTPSRVTSAAWCLSRAPRAPCGGAVVSPVHAGNTRPAGGYQFRLCPAAEPSRRRTVKLPLKSLTPLITRLYLPTAQ